MLNKIIFARVWNWVWDRVGDRAEDRLGERLYFLTIERMHFRKEEVMDHVD